MLETKQLGKRGELAAKEYLLKHNYRILETNYKDGYQELDIIAQKNKEFVFVEVKTRIRNFDSEKENPLSQRQVKNLKIAIFNYTRKKFINIDSLHFDLIFILVNKNKNSAELRHYRDAF